MKKIFALFIIAIIPMLSFGDTQYYITNPVFHVDDPNTGEPLIGGKIYFYWPNSSSVEKDIFEDSAGTTPYTQPVVLDAAGNAKIYGATTYDIVIQNANSVVLETMEDVQVSTTITSFAESILSATSATDVGTALGLGTAAYEDVGTDANEVIQLDAYERLPQVNASRLVGFTTDQIRVLPRSYLSGFQMSTAYPYNTLTISAGACRDVADSTDIIFNGSYTKTMATFSNGNGGCFSNAMTITNVTTWYDVYAIASATRSNAYPVDFIIAEGSWSDTKYPEGYSYRRRIGSIIRDGTDSAVAQGIQPFKQFGDEFVWMFPAIEENYLAIHDKVDEEIELDFIPDGIRVKADLSFGDFAIAVDMYTRIYIHDPDYAIPTVYYDRWNNYIGYSNLYYPFVRYVNKSVSWGWRYYFWIDTDNKIAVYADTDNTDKTANNDMRLWLVTNGYIDRRGKDD